MMSLLNEEVLVALALPLVFVVAQTSRIAYKRISNYAMARCVLSIANMVMAKEDPNEDRKSVV